MEDHTSQYIIYIRILLQIYEAHGPQNYKQSLPLQALSSVTGAMPVTLGSQSVSVITVPLGQTLHTSLLKSSWNVPLGHDRQPELPFVITLYSCIIAHSGSEITVRPQLKTFIITAYQ